MSEMVERIERVRARISQACERAGRSEDSVRLLAVSKKKPAEAVAAAWDAGLCSLVRTEYKRRRKKYR